MIGIFYGSTTGTTEALACELAAKLGVAKNDVHDVALASCDEVSGYDFLLLGSSTWGEGELQDDWYGFLDVLKQQSLAGKRVALFGCGDGESYPDTFCDALGILFDALSESGCRFIGAYIPEGYASTGSQVCRDGRFIGLAIDEMNESDRTPERIDRWVEQLKTEMV